MILADYHYMVAVERGSSYILYITTDELGRSWCNICICKIYTFPQRAQEPATILSPEVDKIGVRRQGKDDNCKDLSIRSHSVERTLHWQQDTVNKWIKNIRLKIGQLSTIYIKKQIQPEI